MLPEVLGKWYTLKHVADDDNVVQIPTAVEDSDSSMEEDPEKWCCYCGQFGYGQMIMCEHKDCKLIGFHFDSLRIRCPPKTKWYSPSC